GFITTVYDYNDAGAIKKLTNPNNKAWDITPTGSGLAGIVKDPMGNIDTSTFDNRGWTKSMTATEAEGKTLSHTVTNDVAGNAVNTGDTIGRDSRYFYNNQKQLLEMVRDPEKGLTSYEYDGLNRLYKTIRHIVYDGKEKKAVTQYLYNDNGSLEYIIDNRGNATRYAYDSKDRLVRIYYPETAGIVTYTYNKNDQVKTYTDLNGTIITNTYDDAGRLDRRDIIAGEGVGGTTYQDFDYDGLGRVTKASNNDSEIQFFYNKAGRVEREIQRLKDTVATQEVIVATNELLYEYDDNGNLTLLTYPSGKVLTITPDDLDRISTINSGNKALAGYTYEGKGKIIQKNLQNSLIMDSAYDTGRRPTTLTYRNNSGKTFFNRTMDWNKVDLKKFEKEDGKGEEYSYDSAYRLRKTTDTKRSTQAEFEIDGNENIEGFKD
ncbi:MAG: RHS repeat protein, partial [bacterium]|nr:RHS repeat protein [bacterium]